MRRAVFLMILLLCGRIYAGEALPSVLFIGDPIYQPISQYVSKDLKGIVAVTYAKMDSEAVCTSSFVAQNVDTLLAHKKWDLIYINVGLEDLIYRAPGIKSFRALPKAAGGERMVTPQQYEENVSAIINQLKATGVKKTIWGNTTPTAYVTNGLFDIDSEITFNDIAEKVMKAHGIPVVDMHTHVSNLLKADKNMKGDSRAPFFFGRTLIHEPINEAIAKELGLKVPDKKTAGNEKKP